MSTPRAEVIRVEATTAPSGTAGTAPMKWSRVSEALRAGEATCWLSAPTSEGVHTRPVFAAWTGTVFVVASSPGAVKTRYLKQGGRCSVAVELAGAHLVLEVVARRLTDRGDLEDAVAAFEAVY